MEIYQLKYLKAVVDNKSYSKAADAMFVTQPTISIAIKKLEKTLQVTLLKREGKAVVLTEIGERIFPACLRLLRDYEQILAEVDACRSSLQRDIKLMVPYFLYSKFVLFSKTLFPPRFPNCNFIIDHCGLSLLKKHIMNLDFDLLITSSTSEIMADSSYQVRNYGQVEFYAHFSNKSPLARYASLKPEQLKHEKLLFSSGSGGVGAVFNDYFQANNIKYHSIDKNYPPNVLLTLARDNVGIALLPRQDILPSDVSFRPLDPPLTDDLIFFFDGGSPRGDSISEFMDYLVTMSM